ncbi:MAG TPA: hypothetical protein VME68_08240 [Acidobacteriaceae bacterium]|nr:hypothetical protein [Acidobacteriaceae bacterium]
MRQRWIVVLKVLVHGSCLAPVAWLLWRLYLSTTSDPIALGPDPTHTVTFFTGQGTLRLLVIMLAITPVRKLIPKLGAGAVPADAGAIRFLLCLPAPVDLRFVCTPALAGLRWWTTSAGGDS